MGPTLAWAVFLAVSWTWCIGMYLPMLLMRDGGLPYFFAFLIPNVIGAASVGFVLHSRKKSVRFVTAMRTPMLLFTSATAAFQAFFLAWQGVSLGISYFLHAPAGMVVGITLVLIAIAIRRRVDWIPALLTLACSLALGVALISSPPIVGASEPMLALIGLSMVTALGFGLCPYLDLSFNRAVQHAPNPRAAFGIGFFVIFTAIILVATRGRAVWTPAVAPFTLSLNWVFGLTGLHFGAQATFTIAAHTAALRATRIDGSIEPISKGPRAEVAQHPSLIKWILLPVFIGLLIGGAVPFIPMVDLPGFTSSILAGEFAYRLFLGFYGLIFPVWLIVALRRPGAMDRVTLVWFAAVCALAGPFLWVGSIGRDEVWLIPGVSIVLLAGGFRYFTRKPETISVAD